MMSRYSVKYRVTGNSKRARTLQVDTVGALTRSTAKRLVAQSQSVPQRAVEIVEIKEKRQ